ncbi:FkbM family methyltransferase [Olleya sp. HaHaR_3_96]|uniref:FkbM family methyltransferase n=1 Tax=Olleya sp. HaHaR_3_96 TaxID=2745560 RepID=UPI001C4E9620|nr:FkbM family methyltransferase [Olleya sp. HaHaR_3_96]QXP61627.1 FkbM family methyltransferase [Olleya sp. HaHaR_3_96]
MEGGLWSITTDLKILDKNAGKWAFRVVEALDHSKDFKGYSLDAIMLEYDIKTIDILKMNVEGAEKVIFEQNYQYWLSKTKFGFLEGHENYAPDVTNLVNNRLHALDFEQSKSGKNLVFSKRSNLK